MQALMLSKKIWVTFLVTKTAKILLNLQNNALSYMTSFSNVQLNEQTLYKCVDL